MVVVEVVVLKVVVVRGHLAQAILRKPVGLEILLLFASSELICRGIGLGATATQVGIGTAHGRMTLGRARRAGTADTMEIVAMIDGNPGGVMIRMSVGRLRRRSRHLSRHSAFKTNQALKTPLWRKVKQQPLSPWL